MYLPGGNQRLQKHTPSPKVSSSMDQCVSEVTPPSPKNDTDSVSHLDVHVFLKSGKWVARILHPIRKVWVCLGIYSNHEEAAEAYTRKKLQYESHSVQETAASFHTNAVDIEKHPGVKCKASGKWGAIIRHKQVRVCLGSYNTPSEAADAYDLSKLELQSPKYSSLRKVGGSVYLNSRPKAAEAAVHVDCKLESGFGSTMMCQDSVGLNDSDLQYVGSSSLKDGITEAVSCPCAAARIRGVGGRGSVYHEKLGKWRAEIQLGKVRHKLGTYATAEDAREALNRKKYELGLKAEDAQEALNPKKCELGLKDDAEQSKRNQRRHHAYVSKGGRWRTEISHPIAKDKKIHLGIFDTSEEAEDTFDNMKGQFELMFPGYMNRKQPNKRVHLGTLTEEAREAYNDKMREVDLMVCAHKKPKQSKGSCEVDTIVEDKSDGPDDENCKVGSCFGFPVMCQESGGLENDLHSRCVSSSSLKDGITLAASSSFAAAHIGEVGSHTSRGSVYKEKSGKWKAEIQIRNVRPKLGTYATAEDAREVLNQKKCELGLKAEDAQEALHQIKCEQGLEAEDAQEARSVKKCELGLQGDAEKSERNQRRRRAYVSKRGRWRIEISHPLAKAKKISLGTFDTPEEAEETYNNVRRQFELMFPGYMNRKQPNQRVHLGTLTEEGKEAYNNKMRDIDLMVRAHKKPKQSKGSCGTDSIVEGKSDSTRVSDDPFVSANGSSVIKADREEDAGGSMINVNVGSGSGFVTEETGVFDLDVIDRCGRLVDEYSRIDDELWI